jgi:hypothetical protein
VEVGVEEGGGVEGGQARVWTPSGALSSVPAPTTTCSPVSEKTQCNYFKLLSRTEMNSNLRT